MQALLLANGAAANPVMALDGRTVIDHAIDRLARARVERLFVHAPSARLPARDQPPELIALPSPPPGADLIAFAAATALPPDEPFFLLDGDSFWLDGPVPVLDRLAAAWHSAPCDGVLLLHRAFQVQTDVGFGDFLLDPIGVPRRRGEREVAPYVHAGVQLLSPALYRDAPEGAWERALRLGRLRALVHDGLWFRVRTRQDLEDAERAIHARFTGAAPSWTV